MSDTISSTRRGLRGRLYHGETAIDFYGRRRYGFMFSGLLIVVTLVSLATCILVLLASL